MAKPKWKARGQKSKLKSEKFMDFGTHQKRPKGLKIKIFLLTGQFVICTVFAENIRYESSKK